MTVATATMRAVRIRAARDSRVEEVPLPAPAAGEVRVRLEGSGACASSLPVWEGREWFTYPLDAGAPGHEGWGTVDDAGDAVTSAAPGERVAILSGRAFAEYDVAPAEAVVRLPDSLGERPFPGEPLGCAMNIFRRSAITPGDDVAIIGIGFLGALLVRLCAAAGARVLAISRRPFSLDVARQMGAAETIALDDHWRVLERMRALTGGAGCPRVIEAVGLQWPLDLAGELTAERGRLVIAGYHQDGPRQVNMQLWNWRGLDVINAHERDPAMYVQGMRDAIEAVERGTIDPWPLFTHRYPLDRLDEAMETMRSRPDGFLKALVTT